MQLTLICKKIFCLSFLSLYFYSVKTTVAQYPTNYLSVVYGTKLDSFKIDRNINRIKFDTLNNSLYFNIDLWIHSQPKRNSFNLVKSDIDGNILEEFEDDYLLGINAKVEAIDVDDSFVYVGGNIFPDSSFLLKLDKNLNKIFLKTTRTNNLLKVVNLFVDENEINLIAAKKSNSALISPSNHLTIISKLGNITFDSAINSTPYMNLQGILRHFDDCLLYYGSMPTGLNSHQFFPNLTQDCFMNGLSTTGLFPENALGGHYTDAVIGNDKVKTYYQIGYMDCIDTLTQKTYINSFLVTGTTSSLNFRDNYIGLKNVHLEFRKCAATQSGGVAIVGNGIVNFDETDKREGYGLLCRYDIKTLKIWERHLYHSDISTKDDLYDVTILANGDIVSVGNCIINDSINGNLQYGWLIRTDKYGCMSPGCFDTTLSINQIDFLGEKINIFPNPAKDLVTINISEVLREELSLTVTDILGKSVSEAIIPANQSKYQLITRQLNSGIYLFHFKSQNNRLTIKVAIAN